MLLSFKKKFPTGNAAIGAKDTVGGTAAFAPSDVAEFIPYYCHYNPHTLLTKNGEVMQVIKITTNLAGLEYESSTDASSIVREAIREAIVEHVDTDRVALWFHTVRKRKSIRYRGKFKEECATNVQEEWQRLHHWKYQYYNEIYVSILFDGQNSTMLDTNNLKNILFVKSNRYFRNAYLDAAYEELDRIVQNMMASIAQNFNVTRLAVVERVPPAEELPVNQSVFYSELMEFAGLLINLRENPALLPERDISHELATTIQTFGFNALETKNKAGKRRFAAILTLKQYREVPLETLDKLVQAPMEFILTQCFHFIPATGALVQYKEQKQLFDISGDLYCTQASGIEDMMSSQSGQPTDFGEHQTSVMVLADEFKQLDSEIMKVQAAFADLGLITIREDVKLEECFWSQLPGNFEFIRRRDTINTTRVGGFCRLNRYPQGIASGNHWGEAITILPTLVGSPYFFNFHHQDNGHTVIFDFNSFADQTCHIMMNFLIAQTRKCDARIVIFDRSRSAELLFEKMHGNYHSFPTLSHSLEQQRSNLNPFLMEDIPRNRSFLAAWCAMLVAPERGFSEAQKSKIQEAIDRIYKESRDRRNLSGFVECLAAIDPALAKLFAKWHGEGVYGGIFDGAEEAFDPAQALNAFDMNPVVKYKECTLPIFAYLLHRVVSSVDGRPMLIVIYDAWDLLENAFIAPRLESLLVMLQQNNAAVVFTTSKPLQCTQSYIFATIMSHCATQMILPDDINRDYDSVPELGISEAEANRLLRMDRQKGDFFLKQDKETIALRLYLKAMEDLYAVFSNDSKNLAAALGKFSNK